MSEDATLNTLQEDREELDVLFLRYRRVLSLVAYRVLGSHEEAEVAVQNCLRMVSDNVRHGSNMKVLVAAGLLESLSMKL
jgi:DNA-directed RNA polymerase specialized sigma24 family protein